jgi:hypothetical protein
MGKHRIIRKVLATTAEHHQQNRQKGVLRSI